MQDEDILLGKWVYLVMMTRMFLEQFISIDVHIQGMLYPPRRAMGMCMFFAFGFMALLMGLMFTFLFPAFDPIFEIISWLVLWGGVLLVIIGIVLVPGARRETKKLKSIIEIVTVRKEVTISEIRQETGLDREYIRGIITKFLMDGILFGYIEDDLFVRDTSGRPSYTPRRRGLFEVNE